MVSYIETQCSQNNIKIILSNHHNKKKKKIKNQINRCFPQSPIMVLVLPYVFEKVY